MQFFNLIACRAGEGRALLEECLLISEKSRGNHHPSLVPHLVNLATSYSSSKNFAEAERLLRISLQIMMKNVPPDDPSITFPMLHLAVTLYNLHRDEEAEIIAVDALRIREQAFGKESLPVGKPITTSADFIKYSERYFIIIVSLSYYDYTIFLHNCSKCSFMGLDLPSFFFPMAFHAQFRHLMFPIFIFFWHLLLVVYLFLRPPNIQIVLTVLFCKPNRRDS